MKRQAIALLVAATSTLLGCGKPVPAEKSTYVGEWRAETMALSITQNGDVAYKRIKGNSTTSVNGPLQRFEGDNFVVGIAFASTTFEVSKPPYQQEPGTWKMVVDGVQLTKVQ
jgi:hypothetical protein